MLTKKSLLFRKIAKNHFFYIMLLPIVLYFIVFNYYPLILGFFSSFQEVGLLGNSTFVGIDNYITVWNHPAFRQSISNTLIVGILSSALQLALALVLALMINEIRIKLFRSAIQTVTYLPYLLSWAIVGGIWMNLLSPSGFINNVLRLISETGFQPIVFMAEERFARSIIVLTSGWKYAGYYAVLLLAAIVSIDQSVYEAASIDGASRFRQIRAITIPNIVPTIKIVTMLASMGLLRNFDQIYIMSRASIDDKIRNMLRWVFYQGIERFQIGLATAAATFILLATIILTFIVRKVVRYDQSFD